MLSPFRDGIGLASDHVEPSGRKRMYESPKLVRFGQFRDLTLQGACPGGIVKNLPVFDAAFPLGTNDGCPDVRS